MNEETKKDEERVGTTEQESAASALPDSNLDGVVGSGDAKVIVREITVTKKTDTSSPILF